MNNEGEKEKFTPQWGGAGGGRRGECGGGDAARQWAPLLWPNRALCTKLQQEVAVLITRESMFKYIFIYVIKITKLQLVTP